MSICFGHSAAFNPQSLWIPINGIACASLAFGDIARQPSHQMETSLFVSLVLRIILFCVGLASGKAGRYRESFAYTKLKFSIFPLIALLPWRSMIAPL